MRFCLSLPSRAAGLDSISPGVELIEDCLNRLHDPVDTAVRKFATFNLTIGHDCFTYQPQILRRDFVNALIADLRNYPALEIVSVFSIRPFRPGLLMAVQPLGGRFGERPLLLNRLIVSVMRKMVL